MKDILDNVTDVALAEFTVREDRAQVISFSTPIHNIYKALFIQNTKVKLLREPPEYILRAGKITQSSLLNQAT